MTDKKYLLLYRTPLAAEERQPSPDEMQAVLEAWQAWKTEFPSILDMGDGLLPTGRRLHDGVVSDGPAVESKEVVSGYSIVGAADYDEAVRIAKACPINHFPENSIEIRELAGF